MRSFVVSRSQRQRSVNYCRRRNNAFAIEIFPSTLAHLAPSFSSSSSSSSSSSPEDQYVKLQNDTRALVERASYKVRGSVHHSKLRRHHISVFCDAVRAGLLQEKSMLYNSSSTADSTSNCDATKQLVADLGRVGANQGIMPDFSNTKALRGYALGHFGRARLLSELVTQVEPDWLTSRVSELFSISSSTNTSRQDDVGCRKSDDGITVASLGGGCAYDFVALSALSEFIGGPRIAATVYEYEPAWKEVVADVETIVQDMIARSCRNNENSINNDISSSTSTSSSSSSINGTQQHQHKCGFEFCDITLPLDASSNEPLASMIDSTQIFSCSYVVAENAVKLRQNNFEFFRQLFAEASEGSLFFFTETTHRLWPEFIDLGRHDDASMRVSIPHIRCGKAGWQLALLKDSTSTANNNFTTTSASTTNSSKTEHEHERELYERFTKDNLAHLLRLDRGWRRDERKVRGAKLLKN